MSVRCKGVTKSGNRCKCKAKSGDYCGRHKSQAGQPSLRSSTSSSDKTVCSGKTKAGLQCRVQTSRPSGYCWRHDPTYVPKKTVAEQIAQVMKIVERLGDKFEIKPCNESRDLRCDDDILSDLITETLAFEDRRKDTVGFIRDADSRAREFPRKVWLKISKSLEGTADFDALAATCRPLNQLLCKDKLFFKTHPLKGRWMLPSLYELAIFKITVMSMPLNIDEFFTENSMPTLKYMLEDHEAEFGRLTTPAEIDANSALFAEIIMSEICMKVSDDDTASDFDISELFEPPPADFKIKLHDESQISESACELIMSDREMFMIVKTNNTRHDESFHRKVNYNFVKLRKGQLVNLQPM